MLYLVDILARLASSFHNRGLDPFAYLCDLLRRTPPHPQSRIGELLPDVWKNPELPSA
jgi:hypothetical protein